MGEELDVKGQRVRAWLERVRAAAAEIDPLVREIAAMRDAYDDTITWHTSGGAASKATHSDPTAAQAMARAQSFGEQVADRQRKLDALISMVGECGRWIERMATELSARHRDVIEYYYIDLMPTWSEVADEMGVTYRRVLQLRCESYEWLDNHVMC
jgi:DNA-directed RNA polymerase specialized sigma subunit